MTHDIIIIGAGPGGYEAAAHAVAQGLRVLLIEKSHLGGTCLNQGCIPTKAFCRSAQVADDVAAAATFGVILPQGDVSVDIRRVVERKDAIVEQLRESVALLCEGADIVRASARFLGPHEVEADGTIYSAPRIIVATGSQAASLPIEGADLAVTATELLSLEVLPESLAIVGGGVIGMEFASVFASFGVEVTVIEYCKEILPMFDRDVVRTLRSALKRRGVTFHTEAKVTDIRLGEGVRRIVRFERKGKAAEVEAEMVLMAVGRRPVIPEGLAECGVEISRRGIVVDNRFETAVPGIFAIGDCNGICLLAHAASAQAAVVMGDNVDLSVVPSAVFTVPECAMVGSTEEQLQAQGLEYNVAKSTFRTNGKALAMGEPEGVVKMITDPATGLILGCQIVGPHAADLIAEVALAISSRLTAAAILSTIHTHPSLSEALLPPLRP